VGENCTFMCVVVHNNMSVQLLVSFVLNMSATCPQTGQMTEILVDMPICPDMLQISNISLNVHKCP
jgi:hypothetical protein